jgi:protein-S-isoprenylcysteine O-methyltransferase Ste14
MNASVLVLHLCAFLFIGALPIVFFVRGHLGWRWWLTGAPFFIDGGLVAAALLGWVPATVPSSGGRAFLEVASVVCGAGAIALIAFALGSHRIPIALWHQEHDAPRHIVTWGAYGRIRHPFYAAFLLEFLGVALVLPHPATFAILAYGALVLTLTAAREERRLLGSELGAEYAAYMRRTGRFLPRWSPEVG